jgi:hypothetical protein
MGWVLNATSRPLYTRERPDTHCIECWVGPRAGLDGCGKSRPPPAFDPRTVQPVASRLPGSKHVRYIFVCALGDLIHYNESTVRGQESFKMFYLYSSTQLGVPMDGRG